jgi:hypothetical protein
MLALIYARKDRTVGAFHTTLCAHIHNTCMPKDIFVIRHRTVVINATTITIIVVTMPSSYL